MDPWADPDYVRDERENDPPARGAAVIADRRRSGVNDHAPAAPLADPPQREGPGEDETGGNLTHPIARSFPLAPVAVLVKYGLWPNTHTERDTDTTDEQIAEML
jgi:hypothetical protein